MSNYNSYLKTIKKDAQKNGEVVKSYIIIPCKKCGKEVKTDRHNVCMECNNNYE